MSAYYLNEIPPPLKKGDTGSSVRLGFCISSNLVKSLGIFSSKDNTPLFPLLIEGTCPNITSPAVSAVWMGVKKSPLPRGVPAPAGGVCYQPDLNEVS